MNARIIKETKSLLPSFLITMGVTLAASAVWRGVSALSGGIILFTICCAIMGASCFGNEFQYKTLPLLLVQPVSRQKIWSEKMRVLGAAVIATFLTLLACVCLLTDKDSIDEFLKPDGLDASFFLALCLVPLVVVCTTPFYALTGKSTLMGTLLAFFFPMAIVMTISAAVAGIEWLFSLDESRLFFQHPAMLALIPILEIGGVLAYCALLYWLGYKRFLRLEAVDSQSREVALPQRWEAFLARPLRRLMPGYSSPFSSLLHKEFCLQKACYLIGAVLCAAAFVEALVWKIHPTETLQAFLALNLAVCVFIIPLVATGISIADERSLGVTSWQFVLPPSRRKQWLAKMAALFITCVFLGIVLPALMWEIGRLVFKLPISPLHLGGSPAEMLFWTVFYLLLLQIGIFASSISSSAMRAVLSTLGLIAGGGCVFGLVMYRLDSNGEFYRSTIMRRFNGPLENSMILPPLFLLLLILLLFYHRLAWSNYRMGEPAARRKWIHSAVIVGSIGFLPLLLLILLVLLRVFVWGL